MSAEARVHLRKFGLVVGGLFLLLASYSWWRGHEVAPLILAALGAPLVMGGALAPHWLAPVERRWMALAHVLGRINTTLILGLLFYLVFTPIGMLRRLGGDPLSRRMGEAKDSHWVRRESQQTSPDSYRHQF